MRVPLSLMRIAHLIARAESVPHYVPSMSRLQLCFSNKKKNITKRKPSARLTVTFR